jgi:hypothetical protein
MTKALTDTKKLPKEIKKRFITILKEDFHFDPIKEMIELYHKVSRSRMKKHEKYKFQFTMLSKIFEYALPKLRVEENTKDTGDQIQFNIMLGGPQTSQGQLPDTAGNPAITIPTKVDPNGSYTIDLDKQ